MTAVSDKVVVITGGRKGLGAALVDEVVKRGARTVYSTARSAYDDVRPDVVTVVTDVRSQESIDELVNRVGAVDIVINNAGVLFPSALLTGDLDDVIDTFEVNAFGPLRVVRAFAPILAVNGGGAVVTVASVLSWLAGSGAYGASKAAAWSITNSLRAELAAQNTQVLGVHAGFIDTEMVAAIDQPKTAPAVVAARIIDALEAGEVEVLTDEVTVAVKSMLAGPVEDLVFSTSH